MSLDLTSSLVIVAAVLVVVSGLSRIYFDNIQDFFLRRVVFAATRLVFLVQDTGDIIYTKGWSMICECLEEIPNQTEQMTIEEIFRRLFEELNLRKSRTHNADDPYLETQVVSRAMNIATLWLVSIRSEVEKTEKMGNLKIEVRSFVKMIKDLNL